MNIDLQSFGKTISIPIPEKYDRIGIAMSGGMDSALLASYLFEHVNPSQVTVYTVDLGDSVGYVEDIVKHLGVYANIKVVPNPKNANGALSPIFTAALDVEDYFYTGTTNNPPWADKIPEGQKPYRYVKTQWKNMLMPFGTSLKTDIANLYHQENKLDLLELTHTCTESIHTNCGLCFACRERWWSFESIGLKDCIEYETHEAFATL